MSGISVEYNMQCKKTSGMVEIDFTTKEIARLLNCKIMTKQTCHVQFRNTLLDLLSS